MRTTSTSSQTDPGGLPVEVVLLELRAALDAHGVAVLEAPPGAGKTTRVPLDLLQHGLEGRLVLLEPRRVAARAAAERLAAQLGERVGERVGLTTRDDRRVSAATRIEVVTEGVLLRRIQRDPALAGVGTLFLDEFHERNLEGDLSLAFALEARAALRPDLRILIASATLEGARVASLAGDAPVVEAQGRQHPVDVEHRPRPDERAMADAVVDAVAGLVADGVGDVLVFLPGAREIRRTLQRFAAAPVAGDPVVVALHGGLPPREQDVALRPAPSGRRKVVLATDIAESSLTIEGVTAVVDAGWSREPRFDAATGMTGLVTVPASRASAEQRAGRAGRTGPGRCVRLWPEREHAGRDPHPRPAIVTDDLTGAALEVAAWGADVAELALLDQPPVAGWSRAHDTLRALGAVEDGRIATHGRELATLPLHPRLGHLLLSGRERGLGVLAADVAAVLTDRDPFVTSYEAPSVDLTARVRALRGEALPHGVRARRGALARARKEASRLRRIAGVRGGAEGDPDRTGELVALGWPERIAGLRSGRRGAFLLAGGRGAEVSDGDALAGEPWLAVAHLDRGTTDARILLAAPLDLVAIRDVAGARITTVDEVAWRDGDVVAERREQLDGLVLTRTTTPRPDRDVLLRALLDGIRAEGLELLDVREDDRQLQARVALVRRTRGEEWPDLTDERLLDAAADVIGPFLLGARRRSDLSRVRLREILRSQLAPQQVRTLDQLAPTHLDVPSGSRIRLDYMAGERPVLAVRVQELFGARRTPTVVDGRVPVLLHLLSPARRPVQVTDDLAGFWDRAYPQVRSELRGRYPKHAWPEDPTTATPTRGTGRMRPRG